VGVIEHESVYHALAQQIESCTSTASERFHENLWYRVVLFSEEISKEWT
jgi:hypothetical protein